MKQSPPIVSRDLSFSLAAAVGDPAVRYLGRSALQHRTLGRPLNMQIISQVEKTSNEFRHLNLDRLRFLSIVIFPLHGQACAGRVAGRLIRLGLLRILNRAGAVSKPILPHWTHQLPHLQSVHILQRQPGGLHFRRTSLPSWCACPNVAESKLLSTI